MQRRIISDILDVCLWAHHFHRLLKQLVVSERTCRSSVMVPLCAPGEVQLIWFHCVCCSDKLMSYQGAVNESYYLDGLLYQVNLSSRTITMSRPVTHSRE